MRKAPNTEDCQHKLEKGTEKAMKSKEKIVYDGRNNHHCQMLSVSLNR